MVLVALFACVFAEAQDQEAAEQYFRYSFYKFTMFSKICQLIRNNILYSSTYGYYPSWYSGFYGAGYAGVRSGAYPYYSGYRSYSPYAYNTGYYHHGYAY